MPVYNGEKYLEGRSFMYGSMDDCQKWIDKLSTTGAPVEDKRGFWTRKERVIADEPIGKYIDKDTGEPTETNNAMIVYSKNGSHIYPRR